LKREDLPSGNAIFDRVFDLCNYSNLNSMEKEDYRKSVLEYEDVQDVVTCTRQEGFEEGLEQGLEQGMKQGLELGRSRIAKNLLEMGMDIPTVQAATGLCREDVESLMEQKDD